MEFSPAGIAQLATALAAAQAEIKSASKDKDNPHFRSKYADLASVWDACRDAITKHGLAVSQTIATSDNREVHVATVLLHKSGEWIKDTLTVPAVQATPQAIGSAITYARRYALAAIVGVAPDDDDDGHAATRGTPRPEVNHFEEAKAKQLADMQARADALKVSASAAAASTAEDLKMRYTGMRAQLVKLFGEPRTRTLMKEFTDECGTDREGILTKMREAIAEEERAHPMVTGGK